MAPQIVLPPGQIQLLKDELELAAEHAFEDAWRRNNRYQLQPEPELVVDADVTLTETDETRFLPCITRMIGISVLVALLAFI